MHWNSDQCRSMHQWVLKRHTSTTHKKASDWSAFNEFDSQICAIKSESAPQKGFHMTRLYRCIRAHATRPLNEPNYTGLLRVWTPRISSFWWTDAPNKSTLSAHHIHVDSHAELINKHTEISSKHRHNQRHEQPTLALCKIRTQQDDPWLLDSLRLAGFPL